MKEKFKEHDIVKKVQVTRLGPGFTKIEVLTDELGWTCDKIGHDIELQLINSVRL